VHALLRDGATLVTEPAHVVELLAPMGEHLAFAESATSARDTLGPSAQSVLDAFPARRTVDASAVAVAAGLPVGAALRDLALLTVEGWIERVEAGYRLTDKARSA
jgi:DNA processing protein